MMLVSAENLLRICPRGVMSNNLRGQEVNTRNTVAFKPKVRSAAWLPDGGVDDLVEQVVVKVGGCRKTQKLHSERGDEA